MPGKYEWGIEAMETVIPYKSISLGTINARSDNEALTKARKKFPGYASTSHIILVSKIKK